MGRSRGPGRGASIGQGATRDDLVRDGITWAVIVAWTTVCAWAQASPSGISWHFFADGTRILLHGSGLHLYARHPELQIGPLAFLAVAAWSWLPAPCARVTAQVLMTAALPVVLAVLWPLVERTSRRRTRVLLAAVVLAPAWAVLAVRWAHADDVVALLALVVAVRTARRDHAVATGIALAVAAGAKPWAVLGLPLLLLLNAGRGKLIGAVAAAAGIALVWGPFLVADSGTLTAFHPQVGISASSVLALLGYTGTVIPAWDRAAQLLAAPAAALAAVLLRAWPAALLCGVAARLALDPQDIAYYAAGAAVAAAVADLLGTSLRVPWLTLVTVLALWQPFVADFAQRLGTSHGVALWWFEHQGAVAAVHLAWAGVVPLAAVLAVRRGHTSTEPR